jgi:hypothetical protein
MLDAERDDVDAGVLERYHVPRIAAVEVSLGREIELDERWIAGVVAPEGQSGNLPRLAGFEIESVRNRVPPP